MVDQTLVRRGEMKQPSVQTPVRDYTLRHKLTWRWKATRCWTRYMAAGRQKGVTELVDFIVGNYVFRAGQVPSELTALGKILVSRRPSAALEIGTFRGGTLLFLTRLASADATIVSVDLPGGRFGGGYSTRRRWVYQRFARHGQQLHLLEGDSHSSGLLGRVKTALDGRALDYLFIDGDHTYYGVKKDFELYSPLVRSGGVIAFHDIVEHPPARGCEVSRFWGEIKSRYRHEEIIEDRRQGWAGIGVLYVE